MNFDNIDLKSAVIGAIAGYIIIRFVGPEFRASIGLFDDTSATLTARNQQLTQFLT